MIKLLKLLLLKQLSTHFTKIVEIKAMAILTQLTLQVTTIPYYLLLTKSK
jgi:hypothetical protein